MLQNQVFPAGRHILWLGMLTRRLCSKDASCGKETPKCDSKGSGKSSCKRTPKPKDCKKKRAPYPSFSECKKNKIPPKSPSECDCLKLDK